MNNIDLQEFARNVFDAQPFSQLLGAELIRSGQGSAELRLPLKDDLKQQHGYAHGGVVSYLADNAITFAGGLGLGGDAVTSEYKINYVKPALGTALIARAQARSIGKRQAICVCDVFVEAEAEQRLCAIAQGTVVNRSGNAGDSNS